MFDPLKAFYLVYLYRSSYINHLVQGILPTNISMLGSNIFPYRFYVMCKR